MAEVSATMKVQNMVEVSATMHAWKCRMKWYSKGEKTVKARANELNHSTGSSADSY